LATLFGDQCCHLWTEHHDDSSGGRLSVVMAEASRELRHMNVRALTPGWSDR
jgi:hypothetical protein